MRNKRATSLHADADYYKGITGYNAYCNITAEITPKSEIFSAVQEPLWNCQSVVLNASLNKIWIVKQIVLLKQLTGLSSNGFLETFISAAWYGIGAAGIL
jgi:hypothetical protein